MSPSFPRRVLRIENLKFPGPSNSQQAHSKKACGIGHPTGSRHSHSEEAHTAHSRMKGLHGVALHRHVSLTSQVKVCPGTAVLGTTLGSPSSGKKQQAGTANPNLQEAV